MATRILRPLGYGELLDELFDLYKKNFLLFAGIAGIVQIPIGVLMTIAMIPIMKMSGTFGPHMPPPDPNAMFGAMIPSFVGIAAIGVVGSVLQFVSYAATTWAVSACYLGSRPGIVESYKAVLPRLWPLLGAVILIYIGLGVGSVLCCIPGIAVGILTAFAPEAIILESKGAVESIQRSYRLAAPEWVRILVVGALSFILLTVVRSAVTMPIQLIGAISPGAMTAAYVVSTLLSVVVAAVTTPLLVIVFVLLYYDVRVRREGFDIEMLAAGMGAAPAGPPAPGQG